MEFWVAFAISAAFMQNIRAMTQRQLAERLDTLSATYARFLFASPISALFLVSLLYRPGVSFPIFDLTFILYGILGGISQILATVLLIYLYSLRNFAVGSAFKKTESLQAAFIGFLIAGDLISITGFFALGLGLLGVLLLAKSPISYNFINVPAFLGLFCGTLFAASAVFYRSSILSLDGGDYLIKATLTLTFVLIFQSFRMGVYLEIRKPGTLSKILKFWPFVLLASFAGALASLFWFSAFALQNAAYVKAVGQIELLFSLLASVLFFKERVRIQEILGIIFVALSILILAI
ncbi:MAG: EamA family transporter [Pseudomonadota bacterium]|nr:EamA family transporter [Pseudomonadota bacterium]